MMQKLAWKAKNTRCGTFGYASLPSNPTSFSSAWSKPPMKAPSPPNANEYPISAHEMVATANAAMHIMNVLRLFLLRTRPA